MAPQRCSDVASPHVSRGFVGGRRGDGGQGDGDLIVLRWGVLGVSGFATRQMIPAMQRARGTTVAAIASRALAKAEAAASELQIARAYGSYEELIADPAIDAIYNPLPNHLHLPWSMRAAEGGKHVLCEKPVTLNAAQARELLAVRDRTGVLIQEAAMMRVDPRWLAARELIRTGKIGQLRSMVSHLAYDLRGRDDVRYRAEMGGGALLDIGFYPITLSRFCFEEEPTRVIAVLENDPDAGVDRLTSAILQYPRGQAVFTCGIQLSPSQNTRILGTAGKIDVPSDLPSRLVVDASDRLEEPAIETITFEPYNHYTIMVELFAQAVRLGAPAPISLEDSVKNMAVLDALFRSARSQRWETPG
jgi:predicted dehydrogenase